MKDSLGKTAARWARFRGFAELAERLTDRKPTFLGNKTLHFSSFIAGAYTTPAPPKTMDGPYLLAHTGSGGMTSSLSVGVHGSANVRRLLMFPLSPMLVTGRSDIKVMTPAHPQYHGATATRQDMLQLVDDQWTSRTRPVNSREWIESQLPDNGVVRQTAPVLPAVYE